MLRFKFKKSTGAKAKGKVATKKGFTMIELLLVLAIGGLIFLMVFIALPALLRNQRDAQRKRDLALIAAALDNYHSTHKNVVSNTFSRYNKLNGFCTFYKNFVDKDLRDPSTGEAYKVGLWNSTKVVNCGTTPPTVEDRGEFDMDVWVHPNQAGDSWPKIEIGDFQYDEGGYCDGEVFKDDVVGKGGGSSGFKIIALRTKLESGAYYCIDNGGQSYVKTKK